MTSLFVELCAGLASVSGCLQHGSGWKPPVSRMGRKTGYATAILRVMGLRPGGKAGAFLWAEADGDVAALLAAYTQPEKMREIAALIRSWIPCPYGPHEADPSCSRCRGTGRWDARDLWEVLRREERRGLWEGQPTAQDTAAWSYLARRTPVGANPGDGFKPTEHGLGNHENADMQPARFTTLPWPSVLIAQDAAVKPDDVAGWIWHTGRSIMGGGGFADTEPREDGKPRPRGLTLESFAAGCAPHDWPPTLLAQDAAVDVDCVAGWAVAGAWAMRRGQPESGYTESRTDIGIGEGHGDGLEMQARRFSCPVWPPVHLTPEAAIPVPARLPEGTVCYIDPPYSGTTGYKHDFDRAAVIETAQRWASAGARVYISEAEPVPIPGWFHVEIGGERIGQARTFGNTQEWLTCSVAPAWTPPKQGALFGRTP